MGSSLKGLLGVVIIAYTGNLSLGQRRLPRVIGTRLRMRSLHHSVYRDLEPRQGEPTQIMLEAMGHHCRGSWVNKISTLQVVAIVLGI